MACACAIEVSTPLIRGIGQSKKTNMRARGLLARNGMGSPGDERGGKWRALQGPVEAQYNHLVHGVKASANQSYMRLKVRC